LLEHVEWLGKIGERTGEPVDLVADDGVYPAGLDVSDQPLQRRALSMPNEFSSEAPK
jgi:hypothetical protein